MWISTIHNSRTYLFGVKISGVALVSLLEWHFFFYKDYSIVYCNIFLIREDVSVTSIKSSSLCPFSVYTKESVQKGFVILNIVTRCPRTLLFFVEYAVIANAGLKYASFFFNRWLWYTGILKLVFCLLLKDSK